MNGLQFLHQVPLFANLSATQLEPLAQRLAARKVNSGEVIFTQGSPGNSLYIVKSGMVQVVAHEPDGTEQILAHFGPGQVFGEFALLDGLPRSADAVACERSELLILTRPEFFIYLEQNPEVAVNLLVLVSRRLRFTTQRAEPEAPGTPEVLLARLLARLAERYGYEDQGETHLAMRLTRGEMAGLMGCSRAEAEAAVDAIQARGLADMRGQHLVVHDLVALRALGAEGAG